MNLTERANLVSALSNHAVSITFNKVDGSERVLIGTLKHEELEAKDALPKNGIERNIETDVALRLYDLENDGWRSCRYESITKVDLLPEYL